MNKTRTLRASALMVVAAAALTLVSGTAAQAATRCGTVAYDQGSGGASVSCSSTGTAYGARIKVVCNAAPGFQSWTKYGSSHEITAHLGQSWRDSASVFPSCPWPASYSASVQYS